MRYFLAVPLWLGCIAGANGQTLVRADAPRIIDDLYHFMTSWALSRDVRRDVDAKSGTKNDYVRMPRNKAIVLCVDWKKSTPKVPELLAFGRGQSTTSVLEAVSQAMSNRRKFAANRALCVCVVVDQNDSNMLRLPESVVAKHFR